MLVLGEKSNNLKGIMKNCINSFEFSCKAFHVIQFPSKRISNVLVVFTKLNLY